MAEVVLKFKREEREGLVAVGSYLIDAARRFGIKLEDDIDASDGDHSCAVTVESGIELLSPETKLEREHFTKHGRKPGERLACQTKFEKAGEVTIMTQKKAEPETPDGDANERFRKEFETMPFETKIANLLRLEAIALGETLSFAANSPFLLANKLMDVMAEFGLKKDEEAKKAVRPDEHKKPKREESKAAQD